MIKRQTLGTMTLPAAENYDTRACAVAQISFLDKVLDYDLDTPSSKNIQGKFLEAESLGPGFFTTLSFTKHYKNDYHSFMSIALHFYC